ncbi:hypothetical protein Prudu_146S000300 [Prunus dulcis]|uniref:Uncharacterized protein n=1 Tax=Prunus dulcis TaxID=3755 RepID=A0A5H2XXT5_PRUDU|nr:hypothetical protein Prudu_146S000300 [Prunus dulcis]
MIIEFAQLGFLNAEHKIHRTHQITHSRHNIFKSELFHINVLINCKNVTLQHVIITTPGKACLR